MIDSLRAALDSAHVAYEVIPHTRTRTAIGEAVVLGVSPDLVAKTLIVMTPDGPLRVVITAAERLDLQSLAYLLGAGRHAVRLMSENELARIYPEFEVGAVPPLGGSRRDPVVVDWAIATCESIVFDAGSHSESIRIARDDFMQATGAVTATLDLTED